MVPGRRRRESRGARRSIFAELRAALRDPFYRHECRQAVQWKAWVGLAAAMALAFVPIVSCLAQLGLMLLPGALVAEGLLYEMDGNTLQGLMLTPVDRRRVLWAKFAARLRPLVWVAAAMPVLGAVVGTLVAGPDPEVLGVGLFAGLGIGILAGVLWLGQCMTGGAYGIVAVLLARERVKSYLLVLLYTFAQYVAEQIAMLVVMGAVIFGGVILFEGGDPDPFLPIVLLIGIGVLVLAARVLLVNILLPTWIMRYAARNMDRFLLRGG